MRGNYSLGLRISQAVDHTAFTTSKTLGYLENGKNVFCSFDDLEYEGNANGY